MYAKITFNKFLSLVSQELGDDEYVRFRSSMLTILDGIVDLLSRTPTPLQRSDALHKTVLEYKDKLSPTLVLISGDFSTVVPPIQSTLKQSVTTKSAKGSKITTPSLPNKAKVTTKSAITALSKSKSKQVKRALSEHLKGSPKLYTQCKSPSCEVCPKIYKKVALTPCNHPTPHKSGFFPHVSRAVLRKAHSATADVAPLLLTIQGIPNPLSEPVSPAVGVPKTTDSMDTSQPTVGAKKRKFEQSGDSLFDVCAALVEAGKAKGIATGLARQAFSELTSELGMAQSDRSKLFAQMRGTI